MSEEFEPLPQTDVKASVSAFKLRRSKRCVRNRCSWGSLLSSSRTPQQHAFRDTPKQSKEKRSVNYNTNGILDIGTIDKYNEKSLVKKSNESSNRNIARNRTKQKNAEIGKKRSNLKNNALDIIEDGQLNAGKHHHVWNLVYLALGESSSDDESLYDVIIKAHEMEQSTKPSPKDNNFKDDLEDSNQYKSDLKILEPTKQKAYRDELKVSDVELNHHERPLDIVPVTEKTDSNELLNLHTFSDVTGLSDSILDNLEVTNKYIVSVCESSGEERIGVSDCSVRDNCSPPSVSPKGGNNILKSGLGKFILSAASDPKRRTQQLLNYRYLQLA